VGAGGRLTAVGVALVAITLGLSLSERDGVGEDESTGSVGSHGGGGKGAKNESGGRTHVDGCLLLNE
jgi:hypothetical protein